MNLLKSAGLLFPLLAVLISLFPPPAAARKHGTVVLENCRDTPTEQLLKMLIYLPSLPSLKDSDLDAVACLAEREDEDGEIFSELKGLYDQMERHSSRHRALEVIGMALVKLDPEEARDFLIRDLDHEDDSHQNAAFVALGQLEDEDVFERIADRKYDLSRQVAVKRAFEMKTYEQTREHLLEMLKDAEYNTTNTAVNVLRSYVARGAISLAPEDEELFEFLAAIVEDGTGHHFDEQLQEKAGKLLDSLRTLPGAPEPE